MHYSLVSRGWVRGRQLSMRIYIYIRLYAMRKMRVVALISGGKDSCYNMMKCVAAGHEIVALANLQTKDKDELDSFMFQTVGHEGVHLYAEAMGLPLYRTTTHGISVTKEMNYVPQEGDEVEELYELLKKVTEEVEGGVEGVASGAILSDYQRLRVENVCGRLGLVSLAYLWRRDQEQLLREMIDSGVHAIVIKVAALGLNPDKHLGKTIEELYPELCTLNQRYGINICGEGGEYETFTLDCPLFKKKIILESSKVVLHSDDAFAPVAFLKLTELKLQEKQVPESNCCRLKKAFTYEKLEPDLFLPIDRQTQCISKGNWIWVAWNGNPNMMSLVDQTRDLFEDLEGELARMSCSWKDVSLVYLYVPDMTNYRDINLLYSRYFPVCPPARVCVGMVLPHGVHVRIEMLVCSQRHEDEGGTSCGRSSMHVQSHSEWAPANIGPYSQAYTVGHLVMLAGQIGLDSPLMALVPPLQQAPLSLSHVDSILAACHASLTSVLFGTCYYTTVEARWSAQRTLRQGVGGNRVDCPVSFVQVGSLPRGACVEWHFMALKSAGTVVCSSRNVCNEDNSLLTLQESWCPELEIGSWLAAMTSQPSLNVRRTEDSPLMTCIIACVSGLSTLLSKRNLTLDQLTMIRVCAPKCGSGKPLNYKDVQVCLESLSATHSDSIPLSLLATENYWCQDNGTLSVHALRL